MAISKIILNGVTQMDVTQDTVASANLLSGYTATKNDGTKINGSIADGNLLEYGLTDGTLPLVGVAKVGLAHVWDNQLQMMIFGTGQIGTGRVV